jgi:ATP-dependent Lon protease
MKLRSPPVTGTTTIRCSSGGNLNRSLIEVPGDEPFERRIGITPLPAGQAWAASVTDSAGTTRVSRIEVAQTPGRGLRLLNEPASAALRAGVKAAKDYLYLHGPDLVGALDPKKHELTVEVHPLNGTKVGGSLGVGLIVAFCSALLKKRLRGGLVIVGELAGDAVKPLHQPIEIVETAVREGARAILLSVSCRRALIDVSDEIATRIEMQFYAHVTDVLTKAFHE